MSAENPFIPAPTPERAEHAVQFSVEELKQLGHLCMQAIERDDLDEIAREHVEATGVTNPNKHGKGLFVGEGDVPMSDENVYRSVDVRAIRDLAEAGVVRGAFTATEGTRASTKGHATYWNNGEAAQSAHRLPVRL